MQLSPRDPAQILTEKEKECLRRWLGHATAKEIALDLGVSHHAVEKRLKSARAKLGATSSLEAARMLERAEADAGYQQTASQAPDLVADDHTRKQGLSNASVRAETLGQAIRQRPLVSGVVAMSIILAAALALSMAGQSAGGAAIAPLGAQAVTVIQNGEQGKLKEAFARMDLDDSGYLEADEAISVRVTTISPSDENGSTQPRNSAIEMFDADKDGRVSFTEFEKWIDNRKSEAARKAAS
ncbi:MAG: hypothetical protein GW855_03325 [Erythrobacter sp.]|nr:hypothetical protein [Erythrobacter sp.]NCQ64164.1 hypothetical protein [Alphaproteobacteria bacterium]